MNKYRIVEKLGLYRIQQKYHYKPFWITRILFNAQEKDYWYDREVDSSNWAGEWKDTLEFSSLKSAEDFLSQEKVEINAKWKVVK